MVKRTHPNIKSSGLWKPGENDKHDLQTLKNMRPWFVQDLANAESYYNKKIKPFVDAKWSASNGSFAEMVARAKKDIEISKVNLDTVDKLIEKAKSLE